ncbi:MAG: hypothetical protein ACSLEL_01575 [Candidatus Malihini olakiniferum]
MSSAKIGFEDEAVRAKILFDGSVIYDVTSTQETTSTMVLENLVG